MPSDFTGTIPKIGTMKQALSRKTSTVLKIPIGILPAVFRGMLTLPAVRSSRVLAEVSTLYRISLHRGVSR